MTDLHRLMAGLADRMPADATPVERAVAAAHRIRRRRAAAVTALSALVLVACLLATYLATVHRAEPQPTQPRPGPIVTGGGPENPGAHDSPLDERYTPGPEALARARALLPTVDRALDQVRRQGGQLTVNAVYQALAAAGVTVRPGELVGEDDSVAFGIAVEPGACLYGRVRVDRVDIDVGGEWVPGAWVKGCLPAPKRS